MFDLGRLSRPGWCSRGAPIGFDLAPGLLSFPVSEMTVGCDVGEGFVDSGGYCVCGIWHLW